MCWYKPTNNLSMPSTAMLTLDIFEWRLGWNGGMTPESYKSLKAAIYPVSVNFWTSLDSSEQCQSSPA